MLMFTMIDDNLASWVRSRLLPRMSVILTSVQTESEPTLEVPYILNIG